MASKQHTHKYHLVDIGYAKVWKCGLADCPHFMPHNMTPLVIGRKSYCWECDKEIVMDNTNMLDAKPVCYECKHPIAIKSLDELDSILSGD